MLVFALDTKLLEKSEIYQQWNNNTVEPYGYAKNILLFLTHGNSQFLSIMDFDPDSNIVSQFPDGTFDKIPVLLSVGTPAHHYIVCLDKDNKTSHGWVKKLNGIYLIPITKPLITELSKLHTHYERVSMLLSNLLDEIE